MAWNEHDRWLAFVTWALAVAGPMALYLMLLGFGPKDPSRKAGGDNDPWLGWTGALVLAALVGAFWVLWQGGQG